VPVTAYVGVSVLAFLAATWARAILDRLDRIAKAVEQQNRRNT
jgi:hypothetical protein